MTIAAQVRARMLTLASGLFWLVFLGWAFWGCGDSFIPTNPTTVVESSPTEVTSPPTIELCEVRPELCVGPRFPFDEEYKR